jgi:hypothetical protein
MHQELRERLPVGTAFAREDEAGSLQPAHGAVRRARARAERRRQFLVSLAGVRDEMERNRNVSRSQRWLTKHAISCFRKMESTMDTWIPQQNECH